jgi:hypothetical protein
VVADPVQFDAFAAALGEAALLVLDTSTKVSISQQHVQACTN